MIGSTLFVRVALCVLFCLLVVCSFLPG